MPVAEREGCFWVACANPFDLPTLKRLETAAGQPIEALPASETDIRLAINRNYTARDELYDAVGAFIQMDAKALDRAEPGRSADDPPSGANPDACRYPRGQRRAFTPRRAFL